MGVLTNYIICISPVPYQTNPVFLLQSHFGKLPDLLGILFNRTVR